jgi:hypothetical protein
MLLTAVFLTSLSALAFEVLLARMFSISQWNHLSFMVISMALFGFAASGSLLSTVGALSGPSRPWLLSQRTVADACLLQGLAVLAAYLGLQGIPLDAYRLLVDPLQAVYLLAVYLLLMLPFFFAGAAAAAAYVLLPCRAGAVYCASMAGSALGAFAPVVLLPWCGEVALIVCAAWAPLAALAAGVGNGASPSPKAGLFARTRPVLTVAGVLLAAMAGAGVLYFAARGALGVAPSEYKALSQALRFPETRIIETQTSIRGRTDRVKGPHLRFAPGLSLKFTGAVPSAQAVFSDGDRPLYLYDLRTDQDREFARFTLSFAGYRIGAPPAKVLIVTDGGGLAPACALAAGATRVRAMPTDPRLADAINRNYGFEALSGNPRSLLAASPESYDVVHLETWGAAMPGADALHQNHLLTIEAFTQYINRLTPGGNLVVSGRLLLPPADPLRLFATAFRALEAVGVADPAGCIAILRNWDTFTLIAARRPLEAPERLRDFARGFNFDVVYLKGAGELEANRFNVFDEPFHYRETRRLAAAYGAGAEGAFFSGYLLDVAPVTDMRPFPGRFLKWTRVADLYAALGSRLHAFFLAGEVVVAAVLAEALVVAALLLALPAVAARRRAAATALPKALYFAGIGAGFMFAELFFVYAGTFFLGEPVVSLALVVSATLAASGLGGLWAQRLGARALQPALAAATAGVVLSAAFLYLWAPWILALPESWRHLTLCLAVGVPGFALGLPFPLGMRLLLERPREKTFAWAVNGCASVLASILSAQLAISAGFGAIVIAAAIGYLTAAACRGHAA